MSATITTPPINFQYMQIIDVDEIKRRADGRDVARWLLGEPEKESNKRLTYNASAIGRTEKTPSLQVFADGYKDFGNGDGGDVIKFVQLVKGCDFQTALRLLNDYIGGTVAIADRFQSRKVAQPVTIHYAPPSQAWQEAARQAIKEAENCLQATPFVLNYLRGRGLTDAAIQKYHLGYNPTGHNIEIEGQQCWLAEGIVIPWFIGGDLWAVRVRQPKTATGSKYLCMTGSKLSGALFNADSLQPDQDALFVEGEFDAILADQQIGDSMAVVTLGSATNYLKDNWIEPVRACARVFIALDNDDAGESGREKLINTLQRDYHVISIPQGKDITDYITKHGGTVRQLIDLAQPVVSVNRTQVESPVGNNSYPLHLPDVIRTAIFKFWPSPRQAEAVAILAQAIFEYVGNEPFTLPELATRSGVGYDKLHRAMTKYGFHRLRAPNRSYTSVLSLQEINTEENTIGLSAVCPLPWDKSVVYQLPATYADFCTAFLKQIVIPALADQHEVSIAHEELLQLGGIDDPAITEQINAKLIPSMNETERDNYDQFRRALMGWQKDLKDTTSTPLPETRDGKDWCKDYRGALLTQNGIEVQGGQQSWDALERKTGLKRQAAARTEQRIGIKRIEVFHPTGRNITSIDDLPASYDHDMKGAPVRVVANDGETADYRTEEGRAFAAEAIQRDGVIHVDYQQASRVEFMSAEERQALAERKAEKKSAKQAKPVLVGDLARKQIARNSKPAQAEEKQVGWTIDDLSHFVEYTEKKFGLSAMPDLEMKNRILRLIGMYTPKEELADIFAPREVVTPILEAAQQIVSATFEKSLLDTWLSFDDDNARDDWRESLDPAQRWELIEQRQKVRIAA